MKDQQLICNDCKTWFSGKYKESGKCPSCESINLSMYVPKDRTIINLDMAQPMTNVSQKKKSHDEKFLEYINSK